MRFRVVESWTRSGRSLEILCCRADQTSASCDQYRIAANQLKLFGIALRQPETEILFRPQEPIYEGLDDFCTQHLSLPVWPPLTLPVINDAVENKGTFSHSNRCCPAPMTPFGYFFTDNIDALMLINKSPEFSWHSPSVARQFQLINVWATTVLTDVSLSEKYALHSGYLNWVNVTSK